MNNQIQDNKQLQNHLSSAIVCQNSQLFKIQIKQSNIQGAGSGMFAKKFINIGEYICQYHGAIIPTKLSYDPPFQMEDKMVYLNKDYCVISRSPGSIANDIIKWNPNLFNTIEFLSKLKDKEIDQYSGLTRNAQITIVPKNKAFLRAVKQINVGEQIYIDYGFAYWQFFISKWNNKNKFN